MAIKNKINKNSRAAKRAGVSTRTELKELQNVTRAEKTDFSRKKKDSKLSNNINKKKEKIIAQLKLSQNSKLENLKIDNKALLINIEKSLNITNQLDNKILKSKQRARYVQAARKAGWEQTNALAKQEIEQVNNIYSQEDPTKYAKELKEKNDQMAIEQEPEEDHVETFFEQEERLKREKNKPTNMFEMLDVENTEEL
ncbi:hypothetical protein HANVADRAFT_54148 [Hanseniaspora valbyensis NRRL Y-1626]|uniref:Uncharacterized protein n=1 Tax=Hanseniaspora valbyensis NRRL Y-1626 TaxID=766949 RepID=A0A1B7T8L5_9ASCO|nr:hypothetical protein HANVADRAFT_54148 [Hanseniaspora valbyensis NRRL Y-1626]